MENHRQEVEPTNEPNVAVPQRHENPSPAPSEGALEVPQQTARALIGWMTANDATLALSGPIADGQNREEFARRAERARAAVAGRPAGLDQTGLRRDAPPELEAHIEALRQNPAGLQFFNEGWQVSIVDLSKVRAAQPQINVGQSTQRIEGLSGDDIVSLAAVSLPIPTPVSFPGVFDSTKNTWIFSSPNPNLRIVNSFRGEVQPGQHGFGFVVGIPTSFLQVAIFQGKYLFRDGYHRAFGFLSKGISHVPVFVREFATYGELALPAGMLPQESFLGDRPPTLSDYLNEDVSAEISTPITQKMVVVQALEFSTSPLLIVVSERKNHFRVAD